MEIKIGTKLEVLYENEYYKSDVQDITSEYIAISLPVNENGYATPSIGRNIEVILYNDSCIYKFISKVIKRTFEDIPMIYITISEEYKRIQRRKYVRVSYVNYIKYMEVDEEFNPDKASKDISKDMTKCILLDLSGGGCKIKTVSKVEEGFTLGMIIPVEGEEIVAKGTVLRCIKDEDGMYEIGIKFLNMRERIREKIISYTFKIMRQQITRA